MATNERTPYPNEKTYFSNAMINVWDNSSRIITRPLIKGVRKITQRKNEIQKKRAKVLEDKLKYQEGKISLLEDSLEVHKIKNGVLEETIAEQNETLAWEIQARQKANETAQESLSYSKELETLYLDRKKTNEKYLAAILLDTGRSLKPETLDVLNIKEGLINLAKESQKEAIDSNEKSLELQAMYSKVMFNSAVYRNRLEKYPTMAYASGKIFTTPRFDKAAESFGISISNLETLFSEDEHIREALNHGRAFSYIDKKAGITFVQGLEGFSLAYPVPMKHHGLIKKFVKKTKDAISQIYNGINTQREMDLGFT